MTRFIAEVCSNHNRSLDRSLAFVDQAAEIGCDAVKFQLFKVRKLFSPEILATNPKILEREDWELPLSFLPALAERCKSRRIQFGCTPFYLQAVQELSPYVDFYKIASYELLWTDLAAACARTGKPVILSTGMATVEEIERSVSVLRREGCRELELMHCVSAYPTPPAECNLAAIESLHRHFNCPVGWSDHSRDPGVIYRAIHRWGAASVEFHFDLEGKGAEFNMGHCWLPVEIQPVIRAALMGLQADGTGKKVPATSELGERPWRREPTDGLRPLLATRPGAVTK